MPNISYSYRNDELQTIHGGAILSMTDTVTSLAISTLGYPAPTGVSVNISTEFVRPGGKVGDDIIGVGEIVKMGQWKAIHSSDG